MTTQKENKTWHSNSIHFDQERLSNIASKLTWENALLIHFNKYKSEFGLYEAEKINEDFKVPFCQTPSDSLKNIESYVYKNNTYSPKKIEKFLLETIELFKIIAILKISDTLKYPRLIQESINSQNIKKMVKSIISSTSHCTYFLFSNRNTCNDVLIKEVINHGRKEKMRLLEYYMRHHVGMSIITAFHSHPFVTTGTKSEWTNIYDIMGSRHHVSRSHKMKYKSKNIEIINLLSKIYSNHYVILLDIKKSKINESWFAEQYSVITLDSLLEKYKANEMCYFYLCDFRHMNEVIRCLNTINGDIVRFGENTLINIYSSIDGFDIKYDYLLQAVAKEYGYVYAYKDKPTEK